MLDCLQYPLIFRVEWRLVMSVIDKVEVFMYLDELYMSGELKAHDAGDFLVETYDLAPDVASDLHLEWIWTYDERNF